MSSLKALTVKVFKVKEGKLKGTARGSFLRIRWDARALERSLLPHMRIPRHRSCPPIKMSTQDIEYSYCLSISAEIDINSSSDENKMLCMSMKGLTMGFKRNSAHRITPVSPRPPIVA